jgi:hypothetical protein
MKRITLLVLAGLTLGGCGEKPQAETETTASAAPTPAELMGIERKSWDDWGNKDGEAIAGFLAARFVEVGRDGAFDRAASLRRWTSHDCELRAVNFSDEHVNQIADGVVLLTYKAEGNIACGGHTMPSPNYSATLYVRENGAWRAIYYQETVAADASGTRPPTSADAAISIPGTTTADAELVALETRLWETWMQRDTVAFTQLMSDRFVGQSYAGRLTKADFVHGAFDAACRVDAYSLGPIAATPVSDDVVLLTYRAEQTARCGDQPLPTTLMSAGIYVREDGGWKSIFYMETPM